MTDTTLPSLPKPATRPKNPNFSSGPCAKRPGWSLQALDKALTGRSHRSPPGKARLKLAIDETKRLLGVPSGFRCAIMPGSDTGAFEAAMWSMLGARGLDALAWESFGQVWLTDIVAELQLGDARVTTAEFGRLPDLSKIDFNRDVLFTANGTTSGVKIPDYAWIPAGRKGLTFVDATSAIFAQPIDWAKADVVTYSWQKVLGGEAAHGMLILSPRAVERLETWKPDRALPKLFRLTRKGKLDEGLFEGETINTPSMLAVEDYLDALTWASTVGGHKGLVARADANSDALYAWVERTPWVECLACDPVTRSNTSVCLRIADPAVRAAGAEAEVAKAIVSALDREGVAYDIGAYRDAPPGLRVWTGSTIERADIEALLPWLDWAFQTARAKLAAD